MSRSLIYALFLPLLGIAALPSAHADSTIGYISYDLTGPGLAEFDVTNLTGANFFLSVDSNPVTTSVSLSSLNLTVNFASGPSEIFGPSYFTPDADGISKDGTPESTTAGQPGGFKGAISAILTGVFVQTTLTLMDGSVITVNPGFTATITDLTGLVDGNYQTVYAIPSSGGGGGGGGGGTPIVPEPESFVLAGTGLATLVGLRRRNLLASARRYGRRNCGALLALAATCFVVLSAQAQSVKLAIYTVPSSGVAGYNSVTTTGIGFPGGTTAGSISVSFSATCNGAPLATVTPTNYSSVGPTSERVAFAIPASLPTGNYYVSVSDSSPSFSTNGSFCSAVQVTATSAALAACVPTSSLAVTVGKNVTAYVPYGSWYYGDYTGLASVPLEGTGTAMKYATPGFVNSCASNSTTGEVVCTENGKNVDLINGTTVTTVVSGANDQASFTGGNCYNCGVAINPNNNTAVIAGGFSGATYGEGVQVLNLTDNTFNAPFPMAHAVSEDISIDPAHNLVLSPGEDSNYALLQIGAGNTFTEFGNSIGGGDLDSAAEDCTTQIALSSVEFTNSVYITDLSQVAFKAGSPGTWTAPGQFVPLTGSYAAGTSGITSAPGSSHLAIVTGEFGGSTYSVLKLPASSGTGTPSLVDYAYVSSMPADPAGRTFSAGFDPHTITAYTSPNSGKAFAVMADYTEGGVYPSYLAVVDLACVLTQPRSSANVVSGTAAACTSYIAVPAP